VPAEHDDAHLRVGVPELDREADAFVPERGWQPDVGDDDMRMVSADCVPQGRQVGHGFDHPDALDVLEDAPDPLPNQEVVLGNDDVKRLRAQRRPPPTGPKAPRAECQVSRILDISPPRAASAH
jgi:hypothetical protein